MITDILKSKDMEQILKDLENNDKDFNNKEFFSMVKNLYPEKLKSAIMAVMMCNELDVYGFIQGLVENNRAYFAKTISQLAAMKFLIDLCGIPEQNLDVLVNEKILKREDPWRPNSEKTEVIGYEFKLKKTGKIQRY